MRQYLFVYNKEEQKQERERINPREKGKQAKRK
jgi:hypothetical protein